MSPISIISSVATLTAMSSNARSEDTREGLNHGKRPSLNDSCSFSNARNIAYTDSESPLFHLSTSSSQESSGDFVASGRVSLLAEVVSAASGHCVPSTVQEKECTNSNSVSYATLCFVDAENVNEPEKGSLSNLPLFANMGEELESSSLGSDFDKAKPHVCKIIINTDINEICGACFTTKASLVRHNKIHIMKSSVFCPICKKDFRDQYGVKRHMSVHKEVKDHLCDICSKGFKSSIGLERHKRTCHGKKSYVCKICDLGFGSSDSLRGHSMTHVEKLYLCHICAKMFAHITTLEQHILIHTEEKPHLCEICGKVFRQKATLMQHMGIY